MVPFERIKIKEKLVLTTDDLIKLGESTTWQDVCKEYPELEQARLAAVNATDALWFAYRKAIQGGNLS